MRKRFVIILILIAAVLSGVAVQLYKKSKKYKYRRNNVEKQGYILVTNTANLDPILDSIRPYIIDIESFEKVSREKNLEKYIKPGRYYVKNGMSNEDLVNMIKLGLQKEDRFRINDFSDVYHMLGRVAKKTQADSLDFVKAFDKIALNKGYTSAEDLKKYFFNDTYYFYWTVSPESFFERFEKQYKEFWNEARLKQEAEIGLSREQIYALASIVYKESGGKTEEQKTIARLYLNRYRKGMKLQSDPTVIYAINKDAGFKKQIKRVYYKYLSHPSPYNTYVTKGIPPGPICVVDKSSVDAVLNPEKHNYLYMCANPKRPGFHKFTDSGIEHMKNAREYRAWLNKRQIK